MQFNVEVKGVKEALELFNPVKVNRAAMSALNESAKAAKSEASRVIRIDEGWKISKFDVDAKLKVTGPRPGTLQAVLEVGRMKDKGKDSFALPYFGAEQIGRSTYTSYGRRVTNRNITSKGRVLKRASRFLGVKVKVKKKSKIAKFPHAFIATMASGHIGVFRRIAGSRKIHEIKVITIAAMFGQNLAKVASYASDYFTRRFESKIKNWKQL